MFPPTPIYTYIHSADAISVSHLYDNGRFVAFCQAMKLDILSKTLSYSATNITFHLRMCLILRKPEKRNNVCEVGICIASARYAESFTYIRITFPVNIPQYTLTTTYKCLMFCLLDTITDTKVHGDNIGPIWGRLGPSGADRTQVGPMLAPWTLLSRILSNLHSGLPRI